MECSPLTSLSTDLNCCFRVPMITHSGWPLWLARRRILWPGWLQAKRSGLLREPRSPMFPSIHRRKSGSHGAMAAIRGRLATAEGMTYGPSWYPDESKLVFSVFTEETASLWEVSANSSGLHRLFPQWTDYSQWYGSWTQDRKYFVFMAAEHARSNQWDIWAVKRDGGPFGLSRNTPVRLTTGPLRANYPVLSPAGKRILFQGVLDRVELARYDLKTKQWVSYLSGLWPNNWISPVMGNCWPTAVTLKDIFFEAIRMEATNCN